MTDESGVTPAEAGADAVEAGRGDLLAWRAERPQNLLDWDTNLQRVLRMHLGDEEFHQLWPMLHRAGGLAAGPMDPLARQSNADENLPRVDRFNDMGERVEAVAFHPTYHELGAMVWSTAVLGVLGEPGHNLHSGALGYFVSHNGEAGHFCPAACTAGLIKLLQRVGSDAQKEHYLPLLTDTDYGRRLHAAQFVTEVQGGSDVGANGCQAIPEGESGMYRIHGEKWFCSVADAGVFVVSARLPEGPEGTRGLGLFLVPRMVDGRVNEFTLRRLKTKLGTRSMATAEIDFHNALAEPIGPLDRGFRNLVAVVLDTSRVFNAVSACGMMSRATLEATTYCRYRRAFGRPIGEFPAMQEVLATMRTLSAAALANTTRLLALSDRLERGEGDETLQGARRIQVMINKYWTALLCTQVVRWGIEVLGGNGTIEEFSVLPRLLRDSIVIESWEGSHNTLCAQVLRDFASRNLAEPWLAELADTLRGVERPELAEHRERAEGLLMELREAVTAMLEAGEREASLRIRHVVDRMCTLSAYVALQRELCWELDQDEPGDKGAILDFFRLNQVDRADVLAVPGYGELVARLAEGL